MTFEEMDEPLRERLAAFPTSLAPGCSTSSCCRISNGLSGSGSLGNPATRFFGELLIDLEEDKSARAVVVGMLREAERS